MNGNFVIIFTEITLGRAVIKEIDDLVPAAVKQVQSCKNIILLSYFGSFLSYIPAIPTLCIQYPLTRKKHFIFRRCKQFIRKMLLGYTVDTLDWTN
jgi:hypothetical protein